MELLNQITSIILSVLGVLVAFKAFYYIIGFLFKSKKYPDAKNNHKYAVIISARNEEKVIGNLLDSIKQQDYPQELLTVFVVADNCQDKTAEIAKEHGAIVYERCEPEKARKGWALEYLFNNIEKDYGIQSFEGYMFFDADNVIPANFTAEMNKAFDNGAKIVNSYRNTKNFDTNFISASYGLHWCRSSLSFHRPRTRLSTTTHIAGTGYLLASEILKDGWHFHELTEDTELCTITTTKNYKIEFCESAEFFDEQPVDFKTAIRQRLRWTKGRLMVFFKHGHKLLAGIFTNKLNRKFGCYDMYFYLFPYALFTLIISAIYPITSTIISLLHGNPLPVMDWLISAGTALGTAYLTSFFEGILILIREQKHIYCSKGKQILYLFGWAWFDLVTIPLTILCLFMKITWKPIKHVDTSNINQVHNKKK